MVKFASIKNMKVCKHLSMQVFKYASLQVYMYVCRNVYKFASMKVCMYTSRRANSGPAWQPSCQKLSDLADIIG